MGRAGGHFVDRGYLWAAAVTFACLAALAVAIPALASRGVTKTASTPLPPGSQRSVTASCPVGTHSTAGGFIVSPSGVPGLWFQSVTQVSVPTGRRNWRVVSGPGQNNPPANLTAAVLWER